MIALWLLYAAAVGLLATLAAAALERLLRLWRLPLRGVWAAAVLVTLLAPFVVRLRPVSAAGPAGVAGTAVALGAATVVAPVAEPSLLTRALRARAAALRAAEDAARRLAPLDRPLLAGWATASALLLGALGRSVVALCRHRRRWERRTVDGHEVLVAPDTGPAVIGAGPARVVLPAWALELDRPLRALVLRHETEHLRAGDPHLLLAGVLALVAAPWNPALWWQLGRLRLAVELDCDRRVLAAHGDVERYGLLLMAVGQRTGGLLRLATPALSEPTRDLERRITAMTTRPPRRRLPQAALLVALAVLGTAVGCLIPSPNQVAGPENAAPPQAGRSAAPAAAPTIVDANQTFFEFQVEQPVVALNHVRMAYPAELRAAGVSGSVIAQFVVDTNGLVDVATFKAIESTDERFTAAVREVLSQMRFSPAEVGGRPVKQLVQQPFAFRVPGDEPPQGLLRTKRADGAAGGAAVLPGTALPAPREVRTMPTRRPPADSAAGYFEFQVERPVIAVDVPAPVYPAALRAQGIGGSVLAQFVVDDDGTVDVGSFRVMRSDHEAFTAAVREALPRMRFEPAQVSGRPVRQLLQMPFVFDVDR